MVSMFSFINPARLPHTLLQPGTHRPIWPSPRKNRSVRQQHFFRRVGCPGGTASMVFAPSKAQSESDGRRTRTMRVLVPEKLSDEGLSLLGQHYEVVRDYDMTPERLVREIGGFDAVVVRSGTRVTAEVIHAAGPRLQVIGRAGIGVDNIDLDAATERGVLVVNAPTGNCVAAAEHTVALMCSMARLVTQADAVVKGGGWSRSRFVGVGLAGKTLGVVGFGRIGREVSKRARGLGMTVIVHDPYVSAESATALGVKAASFHETLGAADFLTFHLPLLESTKGLINTAAFNAMKSGVRIINAARGGIIEEEALLEALNSGKVLGAALDCFEFEPPHKHPNSVSNTLVKHPLVLATPHLGASTREAQQDVAVEIATAICSALEGELVPTAVNAPLIPTEILNEMKPKALLAERLGRMAHVLSDGKLSGEATVIYRLRNPARDTRLLRAAVIKGLMEMGLDATVNIVNAEGTARKHGLKITEIVEAGNSENHIDNEIEVAVKGAPVVQGRVTHLRPHVSQIGRFELDLCLEGIVLAYSQVDRPGQIGRVGTLMGKSNINISFMTLARDPEGAKALVLLGLDSEPSSGLMKEIDELIGDRELPPTLFKF